MSRIEPQERGFLRTFEAREALPLIVSLFWFCVPTLTGTSISSKTRRTLIDSTSCLVTRATFFCEFFLPILTFVEAASVL